MASSLQSITEQRRDQIFPTLDPPEIERVRRFGEVRSFATALSQLFPFKLCELTGRT
jgi:hypothetical protein